MEGEGSMEHLEQLRPLNMLDNLARIIIDQTYTSVLCILGRDERDVPEGTILEISRPIKCDDPNLPILSIHSSARHCCIGIGSTEDTTMAYKKLTSEKQKNSNSWHLHQVCISILPQTIHLARFGTGHPKDYWTCASVPPDITNHGVIGILESVMKRLDAAILCQKRLCDMAKKREYTGLKVYEIASVLKTLMLMRKAMDLNVIVRSRHEKRHRVCERHGGQTAPMDEDHVNPEILKGLRTLKIDDDDDDEPEILKKMRTLKVS